MTFTTIKSAFESYNKAFDKYQQALAAHNDDWTSPRVQYQAALVVKATYILKQASHRKPVYRQLFVDNMTAFCKTYGWDLEDALTRRCRQAWTNREHWEKFKRACQGR